MNDPNERPAPQPPPGDFLPPSEAAAALRAYLTTEDAPPCGGIFGTPIIMSEAQAPPAPPNRAQRRQRRAR